MTIALVLLALGVVGVVGAVAAGVVTGGLPAASRERPSTPLPGDRVGRLAARDVEGVRFSTALRGYRMDEVDAAVERLRAELAARDAELAERPGSGAVPAPDAVGHAEPPPGPPPALSSGPPPEPEPVPTGAAPTRSGSRRAARGA